MVQLINRTDFKSDDSFDNFINRINNNMNIEEPCDNSHNNDGMDDSVDITTSENRFEEIENSVRGLRYFDKLIPFFDILSNSDVVARHDYSCCNSCGATDIVNTYASDYDAYVFYHTQEYDSILSQIEDISIDTIKVHLNWGMFKVNATDDEHLLIANTITLIGNESGVRIEGGDVRSKLLMYIDV
jgi:hypothetical protein